MHDIERYGIGKNELAMWRDAKHATLLFAPRGDMVTLTLLADDLWVGQHTVARASSPKHSPDMQACGTRAPEPQERTRRNDLRDGVRDRGPGCGYSGRAAHAAEGFPGVNYLAHQQMRAVVTLVTASPERG